MAVKKNNYISTDLDWAEEQLSTWREYVTNNPISDLKDRKDWREMKGGGRMPVVVSTIEQQIKCIQDTMTKYLQLLEVVKGLREREELKKASVRGNTDLSPFEEQET